MRKSKTFRPDRIGSYFRMEWLSLALVTASVIYNVGLLATPWFEGRLAQCLADILGGNETAAQMAVLVLVYIAVTLLVQAARFIKRFYVRRFANNINRRMKGVLYANLVRQSRVALEQEGAGELMTKAISDVDDCVEGMRKFTTEIFDTGVALAGYAAAAAGAGDRPVDRWPAADVSGGAAVLRQPCAGGGILLGAGESAGAVRPENDPRAALGNVPEADAAACRYAGGAESRPGGGPLFRRCGHRGGCFLYTS